MALRYIDGFDHENASDETPTLIYKGPSGTLADSFLTGGSDFLGSSNVTPFGIGYSVLFNQAFGTCMITKIFDDQSTWLVGFHFRFIENKSTKIIQLLDGSTVQTTLSFNTTTQKIEIYRGDNANLLAASTNTFAISTWYWIEFKVLIDDSVGTVELRVNNVVEIALTEGNQDTQVSANAYANRVAFLTSSGDVYFDNLYMADGTAGVNDFIGECRVVTLSPATDHAVTWDKSAGATNESCVDEAQANTTDYVSTSVPTEVDKYTIDALGVTGVVKGAQVCVVAKKDDAGAHTIRTTLETDGTDFNGTAQILDGTYRTFTKLYPQNPKTVAAWEIAEIDALLIGMELVS